MLPSPPLPPRMPLALRSIPSATFFLAPQPMLAGLLCKLNIKTVLHISQVYDKNRTKLQNDRLPNCISLKTILRPGNGQLPLTPDKGVPPPPPQRIEGRGRHLVSWQRFRTSIAYCILNWNLVNKSRITEQFSIEYRKTKIKAINYYFNTVHDSRSIGFLFTKKISRHVLGHIYTNSHL